RAMTSRLSPTSSSGCTRPANGADGHRRMSCAACHAQIARTKAVSHHGKLRCVTCHDSSPAHRVNPRAHLPRKPAAREFCGRCHAAGADSPEHIPRIDLDAHGRRYLCWQCHYPHHPEI
ncbi:MAG: hypothetical protein ACE5G2_10510, partial [Candidatus Krumholzibacteriia bacterium]